MPGARSALLNLSPEARDELEVRLGRPAVERVLRNARTVKRGWRGRVVVIHGIMGGKLAVREAGDDDEVWLNVAWLAWGRIADFRLDADGNPANPAKQIVSCGPLDEYLPLLTELDGTWEVLPFSFDWRLDIGEAARRLDAAIRAWSGGEPVHIVAHSMGGLVSRRFIRDFPATWKAMADPNGLRSGGRLVMLGTPNRGSFAIPHVLTGDEKTVRMLARVDLRHDMDEVLDIIDTFPGSYQMLPAPTAAYGDDRERLYRAATWGAARVTQKLLDTGRDFQASIEAVIDAPRLVYVAGYDQLTPHRIRVAGPGAFEYQETRDGDGRVPHELGLLPGVATFYVKEVHGDLPSNERVLAGIHELLQAGTTTALPSSLPAVRALPEAPAWKDAKAISPVPPEFEAVVATMRPMRGAPPRLPREAAAVIESMLVESFVGSRGVGSAFKPATPSAPGESAAGPAQPLVHVEVMWGDLTRADGQVHVAGHYQGVLPQAGELALDRAVSGIRPGRTAEARALVITSLTRRGLVRSAVGDINFFPWAGTSRTVAIAGMGHPGTFGRIELQKLSRSLVQSVALLPGVRTINTLLVGSGIGNLPIATALEAMLGGLAEALRDAETKGAIRKFRIVETDWRRAQAIHRILVELVAARAIPVRIDDAVVRGKGGRYSREILLSIVAAAAGQRSRRELASLLRGVPAALREAVEGALAQTKRGGDILRRADALDLRIVAAEGLAVEVREAPSRVSFVSEAGGARAAAIGDTAVVPERYLAFDWALVDDLVTRLTDPPDASTIAGDAGLLAAFLVPRDFRARVVSSETMIFEVDRRTARIPWEMLGNFSAEETTGEPLGLVHRVSRQLRTSYGPPPSWSPPPSDTLRALVVGDPGDPAAGLSLPGARREAIEVARLLQSRGLEVTALIGAAGPSRSADLAPYEPASMVAVLTALRRGYDILHFAGHGTFERDDPEAAAGWIFGRALFTARELAAIDKAPRLTVANACLSALLSEKSGDPSRLRDRDATLLPGLADEFFKRGVRNYVGTAWPVNDDGAILFATTFYGRLLDANATCLGDALLAARQALKARESSYGALWAAYQHYGDPLFEMR